MKHIILILGIFSCTRIENKDIEIVIVSDIDSEKIYMQSNTETFTSNVKGNINIGDTIHVIFDHTSDAYFIKTCVSKIEDNHIPSRLDLNPDRVDYRDIWLKTKQETFKYHIDPVTSQDLKVNDTVYIVGDGQAGGVSIAP